MNRRRCLAVPARTVRGFSLLELLVAFAIMAMALGMIYRGVGSSVRSTADLDKYNRAVLMAESLVALVDGVPKDGISERGAADGFQWTMQSNAYEADGDPASHAQLHHLHVRVSWSEGVAERAVDVNTLRPQREQPAAP